MATKGNASSGSGGGLKASKMAARGTISEKEVLTSRVCPSCNNRMRQNEISVRLPSGIRGSLGSPEGSESSSTSRTAKPLKGP